jgi:hypothetical protein
MAPKVKFQKPVAQNVLLEHATGAPSTKRSRSTLPLISWQEDP